MDPTTDSPPTYTPDKIREKAYALEKAGATPDDIEQFVSLAVKESASPESPSLAENASNFILGKTPFGNPSPFTINPKLIPLDRPLGEQAEGYARAGALNPLTALEMLGKHVGNTDQYMIDEAMRSPSNINSPLGLAAKATVGTAASLLASAGEPTPTNAAMSVGMGAGLGMLGFARPALRSPGVFESGAESTVGRLGKGALSPEAAGKAAQAAYNTRVAVPFGQMTAPPPTPEPFIPRTGPEIFNQKYGEVAPQIYPESVTYGQAGNVIKSFAGKTINDLKATETKAWSNLSRDGLKSPGDMPGTSAYLNSLLEQQGQTRLVNTLNPTLRDYALGTENPEETARLFAEHGQAEAKNKSLWTDQNASEPSNTDFRSGHIQSGYNVLNKVFNMAQKPTTIGAMKTLRTEVGDAISTWTDRGDQLDGVLKQVYKSLTGDIFGSADKAGIGADFQNANDASKAFFQKASLTSSKIIAKAPYPGDLIPRLIKANSPERVNELFSEQNIQPEGQKAIGRAILDRLVQQSGSDPKKFVAAYNNLGDTKSTLFGKDLDLANSLTDTVKTLNDEIAKSKVKPKSGVLGTMPTLSQSGAKLDAIMNKSAPSELVSRLLSDGSPEMARTVSGAVGPDAMNILRRSAISQLAESVRVPTKYGSKLDVADIGNAFQKLNPDFVNEFFGDDAPTVLALRDAYRYASESAPTLFPNAGMSRGIRYANLVSRLWQKYRLSNNVSDMLTNSAGPEMSSKIIPQQTRNLVPSFKTPFGDVGIYPSPNPQNAKR